eukprot:2087586-Alexandrium_andersonii.AAC.1
MACAKRTRRRGKWRAFASGDQEAAAAVMEKTDSAWRTARMGPDVQAQAVGQQSVQGRDPGRPRRGRAQWT